MEFFSNEVSAKRICLCNLRNKCNKCSIPTPSWHSCRIHIIHIIHLHHANHAPFAMRKLTVLVRPWPPVQLTPLAPPSPLAPLLALEALALWNDCNGNEESRKAAMTCWMTPTLKGQMPLMLPLKPLRAQAPKLQAVGAFIYGSIWQFIERSL